jgi:CelD/BcsL family acetyltransferase involved in cellulose biosynthesis
MHLTSVDPRSDPLWKRLIEETGSSVFQSPEWLQVLTDTYGFELSAHVLVDDTGAPRAGMPFCRIRDILGSRIVTLPFSDYCDPFARSPDQWNQLIEPLTLENAPLIARCLHNPLPLADPRFALVKQAKWHALKLTADPEEIWRSLDGSARRAVQKAQREGITVQAAQTERELRAFFDMHIRIRKYKYRLLAQPYRMFENIWRVFIEKGKGVLLLAMHSGQIIGGVLFLEWKDTLYYKFNASAPADLAHRPNDLLIWEGIQYGKAKGYAHLDFGLSDIDQPGLLQYKRKFASQEQTISFLRSNGDLTQQQKQLRTLLGQLTELLTDALLPDPATERAGDILYQYFA